MPSLSCWAEPRPERPADPADAADLQPDLFGPGRTLGALSDKIGRRRLIIGGWIAYGLVYLGFAFSKTGWQIWTFFGLYGIYYAATEGSAKAFIADLVPARAARHGLRSLQRRHRADGLPGLGHCRPALAGRLRLARALAHRRPSSSAQHWRLLAGLLFWGLVPARVIEC